jgi:gliding motility-associated-like protein
MGNIKSILFFFLLFCIFSFHSYSQIDGIAFKDSTYIATFEHFLSPMKISGSDTSHFIKTDTTVYSFNWRKNGISEKLEIIDNASSGNLVYRCRFESEGSFNIDLEVINDTAGTSYYTTQTISVQDPIEVPNVFTPNGDPQNDLFVVKSSGNPDNKLKLTIYSRNGDLIHEQIARVVYWDGKLASGQYASEGVYYYVITTQGTPSRTKKGFFYLFR